MDIMPTRVTDPFVHRCEGQPRGFLQRQSIDVSAKRNPWRPTLFRSRPDVADQPSSGQQLWFEPGSSEPFSDALCRAMFLSCSFWVRVDVTSERDEFLTQGVGVVVNL